jgi:hypothetical protein
MTIRLQIPNDRWCDSDVESKERELVDWKSNWFDKFHSQFNRKLLSTNSKFTSSIWIRSIHIKMYAETCKCVSYQKIVFKGLKFISLPLQSPEMSKKSSSNVHLTFTCLQLSWIQHAMMCIFYLRDFIANPRHSNRIGNITKNI